MLKNAVNKSILVLGISMGTTIINIGAMPIKNVSSNIQYVNESIVIENDDLGTEKIDLEPNLHLKGINSNTHYRIYIDSTGDKNLPKNSGEIYNDYLIGKGSKNHWYQHLIHGLSLDVTKYAKDKTDFLNQYRAVTFSYFINYNFWNTWYGWSYEYGKNTPLIVDVKNYELTGNDKEWLIFDQTDANHSYNEKAQLILKQKWNGNTLIYDFYLNVLYNWKAGSTVHHASLASFNNDEYTFTKVSKDYGNQAIKVDELYKTKSSFTINQYENKMNLIDLDNDIKRKATELKKSALKKTGTLIQGYYGVMKVDKVTYILSLIIRWSNSVNIDSTSLLNGISLSRTMSTDYKNGNLNFHYENTLVGVKQDTIPLKLSSIYLGMKMNGHFFLPFIYV